MASLYNYLEGRARKLLKNSASYTEREYLARVSMM